MKKNLNGDSMFKKIFVKKHKNKLFEYYEEIQKAEIIVEEIMLKRDIVESDLPTVEPLITNEGIAEEDDVLSQSQNENLDEIKYSLSEKKYPKNCTYEEIQAYKLIDEYYINGIHSKDLNYSTEKTFSEKVLDIMLFKSLKTTTVYKRALMDRRLLSKILSDKNYQPSKDTAIALCFALHLSLNQAVDLLNRAGYALSHSIFFEKLYL